MKSIFKIIGGGIIAFIAVVVAIALFATSGVADTADDFFDAVNAEQYAKAYSMLSEEFKSGASQDQLKAFLKQNGLNDFEDYSFGNRSVKNSRGKIVTTVTTASGSEISVEFGFVKRNDEWKIYSLRAEDPASDQVVSEKEQTKLVKDAMHVFTVAVRDQDMSGMFDFVSVLWQKQTSTDQLTEIFGSYFKFGDKLMILDRFAPEFTTGARFDEDNLLILEGIFPTDPDQVHFEQKFIHEGLDWKLISFYIEIK